MLFLYFEVSELYLKENNNKCESPKSFSPSVPFIERWFIKMKKVKEILFSIIIPHYNCTELLLKLLSTIPDTPDTEVLLIDDNSTLDLSEVIEYITVRKNVYFFKNDSEQKGAGSCRNIGIRNSHGKWLIFADADDFFVQNWREKVLNLAYSDYDMIYFTPCGIDLKTGKESNRHLLYCDLINNFINKPTNKHCIELKTGFCTPWSKMIKRRMVERNRFFFDELLVSNDIMFITKCAVAAKKILAISENIYCVTRGQGSLTSQKDLEKFMIRVKVVISRYKYLKISLSDREFRYAHINRYALGKLVDVFLEGWGIGVFIRILKLYWKNKISLFDIGLLNPLVIFTTMRYELTWWLERRNVRKHERKKVHE